MPARRALAPLLAAAPGAVFAAEPASALRIDGRLTESVWARAEPIVAFVVREPNQGATPAERTEARVLYDDQTVATATSTNSVARPSPPVLQPIACRP